MKVRSRRETTRRLDDRRLQPAGRIQVIACPDHAYRGRRLATAAAQVAANGGEESLVGDTVAAESSDPRVGAGQSSPTAITEATPARPHPVSRSGSEDNGAASVAGKTKASRSAVAARASAELTTPTKITKKPTAAIVTAASQAALRDQGAEADQRATRDHEHGLVAQAVEHRAVAR
jgi:hypothetical protein